MALDDADWRRLGKYVTRRRDDLGLTQAQVQAAGGPSVATQRHIEGGGQTSYRGSILIRLERALRWPAGAVERILAGGEPDQLARSPQDYASAEDELTAIMNNPNRSAFLRAQARAQLDQLDAIRAANRAEAEARGELAS